MATLNRTILPRASAILKDIHLVENHLILNDDRFIEPNTSGGSLSINLSGKIKKFERQPML